MTVIEEAASLAAHWRRVYVRTGDTNSLRTAEVLGELRAVLVDQDARANQQAQVIADGQRAGEQLAERIIAGCDLSRQPDTCVHAFYQRIPGIQTCRLCGVERMATINPEWLALKIDPFTKMQINNSTCFDKNVTRADVPPPPRKPLPAIADLNIAPSKPYIPSSSQTCGSE